MHTIKLQVHDSIYSHVMFFLQNLNTFYFSNMKQSKDRPVLVFKDNLPHNYFIAIPISSKIKNLQQDEMIIEQIDFFEGNLPIKLKRMIRKAFIVSKDVVIKKYGTLTEKSYKNYYQIFYNYFGRSNA